MAFTIVCHSHKNSNPFDIGQNQGRIWAIPAIHGAVEKLIPLHDAVLKQFKLGDRIVYLGNYTGYGASAVACVDEVLTFRRLILSIQGVRPSDFIYLKGVQEEMWQKLLQLQFAPNPRDVLLWMLGHGIAPTLQDYGIDTHDGIEACSQGVMTLTKWTNSIRTALRQHKGHDLFHSTLRRAAHTDINQEHALLFVHAGLDQSRALEDQGDSFWWASDKFTSIETAYNPFQKVIRGYDPKHKGMHLNCVTATIDDGCGFGGALVCAGFDQNAEIFDVISV